MHIVHARNVKLLLLSPIVSALDMSKLVKNSSLYSNRAAVLDTALVMNLVKGTGGGAVPLY